ncbi:transcription elongation factor 1 homolog [Panicum hallii]|uniref:transcription elongation factor 1 homolog n=1 Tax=Panicum hallii TaxID=206008 RepID=UPI000DF4E56A|nr:transcription elongation factor 1 homolog [Panicum hallii]
MGKRKSRTSKSMAAPKLGTEFTCPFCGHPDAVECRIHRKDSANALTEPVDVYSEWIDACVDANEGVAGRRCRPRLRDAGVHEGDV